MALGGGFMKAAKAPLPFSSSCCIGERAMHGRQACDEGEDGGEAAVDEGDRRGLTRAAATGEGEDCLMRAAGALMRRLRGT